MNEDGQMEGRACRVTPRMVMAKVRRHDRVMSECRDLWSEIRAVYRTEFWKHARRGVKRDDIDFFNDMAKIEVNKLRKALHAYWAALDPRESHAEFGADPTTTGDPERASLAINHWIKKAKVKSRERQCARLTLMFDYSAGKVGHDAADGRPAIDRVWIRAIPPWELVLDDDVTDEAEPRFVGHLHWMDVADVEDAYDLDRKVDGITPTRRGDFLNESGPVTGPSPKNGADAGKQNDEDANFVRVLELCNLVDDYVEDGLRLRGRLEIYLVGQGGKFDGKPVWCGPLPYSIPGRPPMPHIVPLIMDSDPDHPLRGLGFARSLMPQQREINFWRSWQAGKAQRDNPAFVKRKGASGDDELNDWARGKPNVVIEADENYEGSLRDYMVPLESTRSSLDAREHVATVERDLDALPLLSSAARTQVTKATLGEVQLVERHSESDFGRHAEALVDWKVDVVRVATAAMASAMRDDDAHDSDEEPEHTDGTSKAEFARNVQEGADFRERVDEEEGPSASVDQPDGAEAVAKDVREEVEEEAGDDVSVDTQVVVNAVDLLGSFKMPEKDGGLREVKAEPEVMYLEDASKRVIDIRPEHLEGYFTISFSELAQTPSQQAEQKSTLLAILPDYMELWKAAQGGGPEAVLARATMESMNRIYAMPRNLWVESLEADLAKMEAEKGKAEPADDGAVVDAAAPQGGGDGGAVALLQGARERVAQDPVAVAEYLLEQGLQDDRLQQAVQMPPEQAAQVVLAVIDEAIAQLSGGGGGAPPPAPAEPGGPA